MNGKKIFVAIIVLAMASAVAAGLFLAGSPEKERMRRFDQERLNDLSQITYAIDSYWNQDKKLPATLEDLKTKQDVYVRSLTDQRTGVPYEYMPAGTSTLYTLCATFETDSADELARSVTRPPEIQGQDFWNHPIGRKCYTLSVRVDPNYVKPGVVIPPPAYYPD